MDIYLTPASSPPPLAFPPAGTSWESDLPGTAVVLCHYRVIVDARVQPVPTFNRRLQGRAAINHKPRLWGL